jgi:hypothetical protein
MDILSAAEDPAFSIIGKRRRRKRRKAGNA